MTNFNDEPKIGRVDPATRTPANDEPTFGHAPAAPTPDQHIGSLPGTSVPESDLESDATDGLGTKGL